MQVRQLAEAKEAELNARVLQLESHIHWLSQDNQRLQGELQQAQDSAAEGAAAAQAAAAAAAGQQQKAAASDLAVSGPGLRMLPSGISTVYACTCPYVMMQYGPQQGASVLLNECLSGLLLNAPAMLPCCLRAGARLRSGV